MKTSREFATNLGVDIPEALPYAPETFAQTVLFSFGSAVLGCPGGESCVQSQSYSDVPKS